MEKYLSNKYKNTVSAVMEFEYREKYMVTFYFVIFWFYLRLYS